MQLHLVYLLSYIMGKNRKKEYETLSMGTYTKPSKDSS